MKSAGRPLIHGNNAHGAINGGTATTIRSHDHASLDDWLQAGYAILAERGPTALTIPALCRRMGANAHRFHCRFGTIKAYREALADSWAKLRDTERAGFARARRSPPRQRLSLITGTLTSRRHWVLERAMRELARSDAAISASVRAADQHIVDAMCEAFLDAGFAPADADLRANTVYAAGLGFLHLSGSTPNPQAAARREPFLDIVLRPVGPDSHPDQV